MTTTKKRILGALSTVALAFSLSFTAAPAQAVEVNVRPHHQIRCDPSRPEVCIFQVRTCFRIYGVRYCSDWHRPHHWVRHHSWSACSALSRCSRAARIR